MSDLLEGVRVIESAVLLNGDTLGMLLGDLGAEVIKVEAPPAGDYLRDILGQIEPRHSPAHLQVNKNKRSIAIDLRTGEGQQAFWKLLDRADVFIDGSTAGAADGLASATPSSGPASPTSSTASQPASAAPALRRHAHPRADDERGAASVALDTGEDGFVRQVREPQADVGTSIGGGRHRSGRASMPPCAWPRRSSGARAIGQGCFLDASAADAVVAQGGSARCTASTTTGSPTTPASGHPARSR